ncbi:2-keto-4-pentenoate hydratase [Variovorax paradoxus]|jgi:2-keto-4-pentenoate hydratase|uniref:2-keto-4-pentenoate hydratase n=1 Tax=Variovorax paradoxus TaxID=34073 RepID=UPI0006E4D814|nr:2-keto-4-pentenoate hydratase [Variovorax paradoxus]KPV00812.1 2-keto-4-pentenoate hydratase [Variovorax paradoxus]KPV01675.1 2-keto-4-pentenoate hydratase [Variovorax paradoxus]KPV17126.1 2-keto-4-pentenoate hydratase [Variovorax paradoxus]KPV26913.1 2-keto-4-pentenoate hydratase [Variovorax paradoxus]
MQHLSDPAEALAAALRDAEHQRSPCTPLRHQAESVGWSTTQENAYAVQRINEARRMSSGDRVTGRKIGLTAASVQRQLGVDQPDYGALWSSTAFGDGAEIPLAGFIRPKVEAEVAIVLDKDVTAADATLADLFAATAYAVPALEIVDSRIAAWDIHLFDTIADNASAAGYVLGADPKRLDRLSLRDAGMTLTEDGRAVSQGSGGECMGHPLNAAVWLARQLARLGTPLRAGDVVLTGALGPMVTITAPSFFEAHIEGLGRVAARFR